MVKTTYRTYRMYLVISILENGSMTTMIGAWQQVGRHCTGSIAESLHLIHKQNGESKIKEREVEGGRKKRGETERLRD